MKTIIFFSLFFLLLTFQLPVYAKEPGTNTIAEFEKDVTGNGKTDLIQLQGVLFSPEGFYYQDIFTTISSESEEWRINYQGGYEPELQFVDLNHDGIVDIFYQSATGGSGGLYHSQLDTLANDKLKNIPLPKQEYVKGYFESGFNAVLEIYPNETPIVLNVEDRKEDYIRLGIYDEDGNVLKETSLIIDPIAFYEPIQISKSKGYGLKSYKQVSGAYHADGLGVIETLWYYEGDTWIALKTEWKESSSSE